MPSLEEKQVKILIERLVNIKAEALVDDLIDKLAEKEAETLIKTLPELPDEGAEGQVDALAYKGGARDTKRNLPNVKTLTLVDALADSVA